jgi:hypothetical protein
MKTVSVPPKVQADPITVRRTRGDMIRQFSFPVSLIVSGFFLPPLAFGQESRAAKTSPPENPPQILVVSSIDPDGNLTLVSYKTIYIGFTGESYNNRSLTKVTLRDVRILTVKGEELSIESARDRISGRDTPILVSSWKTPLSEFYKGMFTPETLHFVFPANAPVWKQVQEPGRPVR